MENQYKYTYFVSCAYSNENGSSGFMHTSINLKYPVRSIDDVTVMANILKNSTEYQNIVIINYKKLGE